jgi:Putative transposase of IS4/5 family (DUF4096)
MDITDELWKRRERFLPKYRTSSVGGRPRLNLRHVADGIFYVLRTHVPVESGLKKIRVRQFVSSVLSGLGQTASIS